MKNILNIISILILSISTIYSQEVKFSASPETIKISPSERFEVNLNFSIAEGWHIYSKESEMGSPTKFDFDLPNGFTLIDLKWAEEKSFESFGMKYNGYDGDISIKAIIESAKKISDSTKFNITANWLACSNTCIPQKSTVEISIESLKTDENQNDAFIVLLLGAFLGGLILNLMPCVFPVIGIKILSFAKNSSGSRRTAVLNSIFYTIGILITFIVLAGLLLILRATGESLGWGFQLQNPIFTSLMAILFFAMALSFAGVFEIGASFAGGHIDSDNSKNQYLKSLTSGILAVLVASPCTAPFMGSALGVAFSTDASIVQSLSIFIALGLGLASPYVVLSAIPSLAKILPKPGNWMDIFKQILSIPLLATVIWLVWVYTQQTNALVEILSALLILAIGSRIFGMYSLPHFSKTTRRISICIFILAIISSTYISVEASKGDSVIQNQQKSQNAWTLEKQKQLLTEGKNVYVDFTASWCLTCQFNKTVLHSDEIKKLFENNNITILIADWTNLDENITKELEKFNQVGVPLNILYAPNKEPIILPSILTQALVIEAVDKLK